MHRRRGGYVLLGSALLTFAARPATLPNVPTSALASDIATEIVFSLWIYGNGLVAVAAPLLLGLLPVFRSALLGQPARWSVTGYTRADEDAAAEDFNIY